MTTRNFEEMAREIESRLRATGEADLIPSGGLSHWVSQGWGPGCEQDDPEHWVDCWREQVARVAADDAPRS